MAAKGYPLGPTICAARADRRHFLDSELIVGSINGEGVLNMLEDKVQLIRAFEANLRQVLSHSCEPCVWLDDHGSYVCLEVYRGATVYPSDEPYAFLAKDLMTSSDLSLRVELIKSGLPKSCLKP